MKVGYEVFGEGEVLFLMVLVGRRKIDDGGVVERKKKGKGRSYGFSFWGSWGSKYDERIRGNMVLVEGGFGKLVGREYKVGNKVEGEGVREWEDIRL